MAGSRIVAPCAGRVAALTEINPGIFREYDVRGVVGKDLTPAVARALGAGFARYLDEAQAGGGAGPQAAGSDQPAQRQPVLVGRDNRAHSLMLRDGLVEGLTSAGRGVADLGEVITPMVYFARIHFGIDGAAMITGSHNPPEFNGFKLGCGPGTIYGEQIQRLRRHVEEAARSAAPGRAGSSRALDVVTPYQAMLAERIRLGPRRLRVVVDAGNGTTGPFAPGILAAWGCDVIPLYCESDPRFPHHHPDPVRPENLRDLQRAVREHGADLGVAFDGDGDRIGVVDDRGQMLWGDSLMALYWREVLARRPGAPAIIEVKCSQALVDEVARLGGKPIFYKTGHSLIKAKMRELGAPFAGEMSGHMFFADEFFGFDDALYAAGRLLRMLSHTDRRLSDLAAEIPRYHATPEVRVDCPDERKFAVVAAVRDHFAGRRELIDVDGARVLFGDGWGLVRASNTQPVLVLRAEARDETGLKRICGEMEAALAAAGLSGPVSWE